MLPPSLWLSEKSILNKDILGVDLNNYQFFKDKILSPVLGQRDDAWVAEHGPAMGEEQQEYHLFTGDQDNT